MKLKLETIPVWDAFAADTQCPLCHLMEASHRDAVAYYTGSSVMHPETRQEVNRTGFCPVHWKSILEAGSAQSVALLSHTFLLETIAKTADILESLTDETKAKRARKRVSEVSEILEKRSEGCLVCDRMTERRERYLYTIIKLFFDDSEFRGTFLDSRGFCLYHTQDLFTMSRKMLGDAQYVEFIRNLAIVTRSSLERLEGDVLWMTQKYKSENADKPWNGCENAQSRTVSAFTGEGRIYR